ncbi:tafazzin protein [Apiospora marii]|uniref:tafazzin protein n=1 Tax=Apiospora marii TaxID=335849 RepID=UPI00312D1866
MTSNARNSAEASAASIAMRTPLEQPSLPWRMSSSFILGATCMLSRGFLYGLNTVETNGLDRFLEILDKREDVNKRERGLITVVAAYRMDDPLMWGILPASYAFNPTNLRWGLGAHDICFKNKPLSTFFSLGQVLPTHRASHSPHGGAFQATLTQAIRLLSAQPFGSRQSGSIDASSKTLGSNEIPDPFTSGDGLTYSTDGTDSFIAPSIYAQNRLAWHPSMTMRYFKWGVARLILESEPMPDLLPMFIDGTQNIMSEARTFPRFLPRGGNKFHVTFGELLDMEAKFGDLRRKWQELVRQDQLRVLGEAENEAVTKNRNSNSSWASLSSLWSSKTPSIPTTSSGDPSGESQQDSTTMQHQRRGGQLAMGELSEELKYGAEAQALRIEVARRVRDEIEKLRVGLGYPEDDPKLGLAETWAEEPPDVRRFKSNVDGSLVTKE